MIGKETKHIIHFRSTKLRLDEVVVATLQGYIGFAMGTGANAQRNGNFIVTNQRIVFYSHSIFGDVLRTISTESITSIEVTSSWGIDQYTFAQLMTT